MRELLQDLRYGIRRLRKRPAWTAMAVATLALGIGTNTAIVSLLDAVLVRPLPYRDAGRLVALWETMGDWRTRWLAPANFVDWRRQASSFEAMAAFTGATVNVESEGATPQRLRAQTVSANLFQVLGVAAARGRVFAAEEERVDGLRTTVLSHGLWQRTFGGDPEVLGRTLRIDGEPHAVIGVMPEGFEIRRPAQLFLLGDDGAAFRSSQPAENLSAVRDSHLLFAVGRLAPEATVASAEAELAAIAARLAGIYPDTNAGLGAHVVDLRQDLFGDTRPVLLLLLAAVGAILLLATINVANLVLTREHDRRRELAIRAALGAGRRRLVAQLTAENLALGALAAGVGVLVALWSRELLLGLSPDALGLGSARQAVAGLDLRLLAIAVALAAVTGVLFALWPALAVTARAVAPEIQGGPRTTADRRQRRRRDLLVVTQIALAQVLLVGAGLLLVSLDRLRAVAPGFDPAGLTVFQLATSEARYPEAADMHRFYDRLHAELAAIPGVTGACALMNPPVGMRVNRGVVLEGRAAARADQDLTIDFQMLGDGCFQTLGHAILRGRALAAGDRGDVPRVAVINHTMAERYWPGEDPIGRRLLYGASAPEQDSDWITVVGIAADMRDRGLRQAPNPTLYVPYRQNAERWRQMAFALRAELPPAALTAAIRDVVHRLDPAQPISALHSGDALLADSVAEDRFLALLVGSFAAMALLLAAVGLYGVVAFTTAQRTKEIGVRVALGARRRAVLVMILGDSLRRVALGIGLGTAAAAVLTRFLAHQLYGVGATDPATFAAIALLLTAVALLASWLPARRAARLDPVSALHES